MQPKNRPGREQMGLVTARPPRQRRRRADSVGGARQSGGAAWRTEDRGPAGPPPAFLPGPERTRPAAGAGPRLLPGALREQDSANSPWLPQHLPARPLEGPSLSARTSHEHDRLQTPRVSRSERDGREGPHTGPTRAEDLPEHAVRGRRPGPRSSCKRPRQSPAAQRAKGTQG